MREENIEQILNGLYTDDEFRIESSVEIPRLNNYSYKLEQFLLTIKSIMPDLKSKGSRIDYERFKRELKLWYSYRHGTNIGLKEAIYERRDNYWGNIDNTQMFRNLAIILTNESMNIVKEEVLRNTVYITGNPKAIIESLLRTIILKLLLEDTSEAKIKEILKKEIIELSLKFDILEKKLFKTDYEKSKQKYIVNFEKTKIEALNEIENDKIIYDSYFMRYIGVNAEEPIGLDMAKYIWKIRKGWIDPRKLKLKSYIEPDIFDMKVGEKKEHSLLGQVKLIKKEKISGYEVFYINTKLGIYRFFNK